MSNHPPVEQPWLEMAPHASPLKMDFSRSARFGFKGEMFIPQFGSGNPVNAPGKARVAQDVVRIDLQTRAVTPFFGLKEHAMGPPGYETVATTGPRRLVQARFSPDGEALYIIDFGAMAAFPAGGGPVVHPFPGTGVMWRVTRSDAAQPKPPAELSILVRQD
jgi:glucose/arabinose dehydrogenase